MKTLSRKDREKRRREQEILEAAEKIFIQSGYDGASMDALAGEAEYTKRTIYQYFSSKEDLFFAVVLRSYEVLEDYMNDAAEKGKNGLERLENGCRGFYRFSKEHPGRLALITAVGHVKAGAGKSEYLEKFLAFDKRLFESIEKGLREGQVDGSVKASLDVKMETCSFAFLLTAFFHLFSLTGGSFIKHCKLAEEDFVEACLGHFTACLKTV